MKKPQPKTITPTHITVTLRMSKDLRHKLQISADVIGLSLNAYVTTLLTVRASSTELATLQLAKTKLQKQLADIDVAIEALE